MPTLNINKLPEGVLLGRYLMLVGLGQLGAAVWTGMHGNELQAWSPRAGFLGLVQILFDEDLARAISYLSAAWLLGIGLAMIRRRLPLKTYLAGEAVLGLPSIAFVAFSILSGDVETPVVWVVSTVFLLETGLPAVWAARLGFQRWKLARTERRRVSLPGARCLGFYLLTVCFYQVVVGSYFASHPSHQMFPPISRFGLHMVLFSLSDFLDVGSGDEDAFASGDPLTDADTFKGTSSGAFTDFASVAVEYIKYIPPAVWCIGVALGVAMVRRRLPLKTYMVVEALFGWPALVLGMIFFFGPLGVVNQLILRQGVQFLPPELMTVVSQRLLISAEATFESVIPFTWAALLVFQRRRLANKRA